MEPTYVVDIPDWYQGYIKSLGRKNYLEVLREHYTSVPNLLLAIPDGKWEYAYAPGKWTVKEVMIHLCDAERIFAYRALCFARNEKKELPGFEENEYVPNSNASKRTEVSIIEEYKAVRNATIALFSYLDEEMLRRTGHANGLEFSVMMIGAIIAGHELHHIQVLKERYLIGN